MKNTALSTIGRRWRELVGFALLIRVLGSLYFAPVAALAGKLLLGRAALESTALVPFLLSPRRLLAIPVAAVTALGIRLTEHAGLLAYVEAVTAVLRTPNARSPVALPPMTELKRSTDASTGIG